MKGGGKTEQMEEKKVVCDGQCKDCKENCTKMNSRECGNCDHFDHSRNYCYEFNVEKSPSCDASDCRYWK